MTGAYIRLLRGGKWQNIEVEYLTNDERAKVFRSKPHDEMVKWINMLCETICLAQETFSEIDAIVNRAKK